MLKYLTKRFLLMIPTMLGVAVVTFFLIRVIPGDVVELRLAGDSSAVSQEVLDAERKRFGLDQPVAKQFVRRTTGCLGEEGGTQGLSERTATGVARTDKQYPAATHMLQILRRQGTHTMHL